MVSKNLEDKIEKIHSRTKAKILVSSKVIGIPSAAKEYHVSNDTVLKWLKDEDEESFLWMASSFTEPGDRQNADAILQLSVSVNREIYDRIRKEDPKMCEALKDLMKDEFVKAEEKGRKEGREEGREKGRKEGRILEAVVIYRDEMHMSDELITKAIMSRFSLSPEDAEAYVMEGSGVVWIHVKETGVRDYILNSTYAKVILCFAKRYFSFWLLLLQKG